MRNTQVSSSVVLHYHMVLWLLIRILSINPDLTHRSAKIVECLGFRLESLSSLIEPVVPGPSGIVWNAHAHPLTICRIRPHRMVPQKHSLRSKKGRKLKPEYRPKTCPWIPQSNLRRWRSELSVAHLCRNAAVSSVNVQIVLSMGFVHLSMVIMWKISPQRRIRQGRKVMNVSVKHGNTFVLCKVVSASQVSWWILSQSYPGVMLAAPWTPTFISRSRSLVASTKIMRLLTSKPQLSLPPLSQTSLS